MSDRAAFLDRYFAFTAAGYDDASATGYAMSTAPVSAPVSAASPSPSAAAGILAMAPDDRLAYAARIGNDAFTRQLSEELRTTKVGGG